MGNSTKTSLKELCSRLYVDGYPNGDCALHLEHEPEVQDLLSKHRGVVTDLTVSSPDLLVERIALSSILSDFTSLYINSQFDIRFHPRALENWPEQMFQAAGIESSKYRPYLKYAFGFVDPNLIEDVRPLTESGRLMLRPRPIVMFDAPTGAEQQVTLEPNLPEGFWLPWNPDMAQNALPLCGEFLSNDDVNEELKSELLLPYLSGVSLPDLAKILDDEEHLLGDFRSGLRALLSEVQSCSTDAKTVVDDTIRPAIDKVQRRFKAITHMHSLRVAGATVSTCALSLLALTDGGMAASVAKVLGPAGAGLVAKELADFVKSKAELREMPYYLLWRISRIAKH